VNLILEKYQRPKLPWTIKAKLQGRPGPASNALFSDWAKLPISLEEYAKELYALQCQHFPSTQPLPGIVKLLSDLSRTRYWDIQKSKKAQHADGNSSSNGNSSNENSPSLIPSRVHMALATSSHEATFRLKTSHLTELFSVFDSHRRVLGDDKRIPPGRGKPLPDMFLLALHTINESLTASEAPITPEECLVFEDSVPGVEAGRRAGMRVVWCPHPMLKELYSGREAEVLAGRTGEAGDVDLHQVGELDDGYADYFPMLVDFPYEKYGIVVPPVGVDEEGSMMNQAEY